MREERLDKTGLGNARVAPQTERWRVTEFGNDMDLALALAGGDRQAFAVLFQKHNAGMVRLATGVLGSRASAEEVTQDAWISVLQAAGGFEGRSSLAAWIFTILLNKARSRARVEGRSVSFDAGGEEDNLAAAFDGRGHWRNMPELWEEITPERILAGRNALDIVTAAIEALPASQKAVLVLRGQQGLEAEEVCAVLSITEANMRVLLHRARLAVRAAIEEVR